MQGERAAPVFQMTEYYREGTFDNCRSKWGELFDCISLKAKPANEIQVSSLFFIFVEFVIVMYDDGGFCYLVSNIQSVIIGLWLSDSMNAWLTDAAWM